MLRKYHKLLLSLLALMHLLVTIGVMPAHAEMIAPATLGAVDAAMDDDCHGQHTKPAQQQPQPDEDRGCCAASGCQGHCVGSAAPVPAVWIVATPARAGLAIAPASCRYNLRPRELFRPPIA